MVDSTAVEWHFTAVAAVVVGTAEAVTGMEADLTGAEAMVGEAASGAVRAGASLSALTSDHPGAGDRPGAGGLLFGPFFTPFPVPVIPAAPSAFTSAQNYSGYQDNYAVEPSTIPAPSYQGIPAPQNQRPPAPSSLTIRDASYTGPSPHYTANAASRTTTNLRPAVYTTQQLPALRPEVQNVIRALRAMPPSARQRQLDSGRYSNLTPAEIEYVRRAANLPG